MNGRGGKSSYHRGYCACHERNGQESGMGAFELKDANGEKC